VTVFAGDPESRAAPGWWDNAVGFATAGVAASVRREEDRRACALIQASPVWLPFGDAQYDDDRSTVMESLGPLLRSADGVLVPGYPLEHPDHRWVHEIVVGHRDLPPIALYAEEPYSEAAWFSGRRMPAPGPISGLGNVVWKTVRPRPADWWRKQRATWAYRSQLRAMARPALRVPLRVGLYELRVGGEGFGLVSESEGR